MPEAKIKQSARNKMMDFLARRDHSEKELRLKLKKTHSAAEIDIAIQYGKERGWLPNDDVSAQDLSQRAAAGLHRKKKGIRFINAYLQEKGLPEIAADLSTELEKALDFVKDKYSFSAAMDRQEKQRLRGKLSRSLLNRGFESDVIGLVLKEMINKTSAIE